MDTFDATRCRTTPALVVPVRLDPTGLNGPTRAEARTNRWRRTSWGRYVPARVDGSVVEQRIVEQAARLPPYGAVTAWAALRLWGAAFFDGQDHSGMSALPVPMIVPSHLRPDPAAWLSFEQLHEEERTHRFDVPVTIPERALFDEMRRRGALRPAVMAADMAFAAGVCSPGTMADFAATRTAWTGIPMVREALALSRDGSQSPQETRMRLIWVLDAGFPEPLLNPRLVDLEGEYLGKPDLFDPEAGVVGEYDGEYHRSRDQHRRDVQRESRFRDAGLEYFTVVAGEPTGVVVDRMHRARRRAPWLSPDRRQWRLVHHR